MIHRPVSRPEVQPPEKPRRDSALSPDFFRALHALTAGQGERRLAVAVLEEAVHCIERNRGAKDFLPRLHAWEAERWFESRERGPLFSFENVCAILSLDSAWIRDRIRRWRERLSLSTPALPEDRPGRASRSAFTIVPSVRPT